MIQTTFSLSFIAWILLEIWVSYREKGTLDKSKDKNTRKNTYIIYILAIIIGNIFANFPYLSLPGSIFSHFLIGTIIIWSGLILRFWSIQTLGKFFKSVVMIQNKHQLIKKGPYRFLRHPSYTGGLLIITGIAIGLGNWIGLVIMETLIFVGVNQRIKVEEKALTESFGKKYHEFKKHTKKLIPFIY